MTLVPQPPYSADLAACDLFLFPRLKIKQIGRHFYIFGVIVLESQVLPPILTEHNIQDVVLCLFVLLAIRIKYIL
jgi:hypothetical protein